MPVVYTHALQATACSLCCHADHSQWPPWQLQISSTAPLLRLCSTALPAPAACCSMSATSHKSQSRTANMTPCSISAAGCSSHVSLGSLKDTARPSHGQKCLLPATGWPQPSNSNPLNPAGLSTADLQLEVSHPPASNITDTGGDEQVRPAAA